MPSYTYICGGCGLKLETIQAVQEMRKYREQLRCRQCEGHMQFIFPAPALSTDVEFMRNRDDGFGRDNQARKYRYAKAKREGVSTNGKFWSPSLNTWIGSKDDVKRICQERGKGCEGMVKVKAPEFVPLERKGYTVAPDIVRREVQGILADRGHEMSAQELKDLPEVTKHRLSGTQD